MKKLSILFIGLLLVSGLAFASDEFEGTPATDIDITASVTWGVDLNTGYTGFQNAGSFDLELKWLDDDDELDFEAGGDDGLYGYILIEDAQLEVDGGFLLVSVSEITASVVIDPAEITIYHAPGMSWGNAAKIEAADVDVKPALTGANTIGGITVTLADLGDMVDVDLYVVSDGDWLTNSTNSYAAGADLEVGVSIVTVSVGGFYGWFDAATWGATAELAVNLEYFSTDGVDISVGMDFVDGGAWDLAFNTTLNFSEENEDEETGNLAVDVYYSDTADLDAQIAFSEPTDMGIMDMLGASFTLQLLNLTSGTISYNVDVTGEYDTGDVMPYFGFGYGTDEVLNLNVGVELYEGLTGIDNTDIVIDYTAKDLTDADPLEANDIGQISIMVEVSF
jgi:hypothetical protein